MAIYYLGSFPPEYGGVTIKNKNLFEALTKDNTIFRVDFSEIKRKNIIETCRLIIALCNRRNIFIVGVAGIKTRKKFCKLLYYVNRKAMAKSIIFIMGGIAVDDIVEDLNYAKYIRTFKKVYVETIGMKNKLESYEFQNVDIYPNGRFKLNKKCGVQKTRKELCCVFFSLISLKKGVDIILEAAKKLPNIKFDFYGPIVDEYKGDFTNGISLLSNVKYNGIFTGSYEETISKLQEYDVLLLPTKHITEGVPGILVESKIAGITAIVSNVCYNSEIISTEQGIVLKENDGKNLTEAIKLLDSDRSLLLQMKKNSYASAENYYIENYIDKIEADLK